MLNFVISSLSLFLSISLSLPPTLLILLSSSLSNVVAPTETVTSLPLSLFSLPASRISPRCHCIVSLPAFADVPQFASDADNDIRIF